MMKNKIRIIAVWLALAGAAVILAGPASAGLGVAPLKQEISVKPGETATFYISIINKARGQGDATQSARLEIMDFDVTEDGGLVFKEPSAGPASASKWITLGKSEVILDSGRDERIACTVKVPYSAAGEYYSAVMVTLGHKGRTDSGVGLSLRIASGVFITVLGQTFPRQAKIEKCEFVWPASLTDFYKEGPPAWPQVKGVLRNAGKSRFEGSGTLEIIDAGGRPVLRKPLVSKRPLVFGGDSRIFRCSLDKVLPAGEYRARLTFDYQSQWGKACNVSPVTISADQASLLALLVQESASPTAASAQSALKISPDKLVARIAAGGNRSMGLSVRNTSRDLLHCTATLVAEGDSSIPEGWIALAQENFVLDRLQSACLPMAVRVPAEATGTYSGTLVVEAVGAEGEKTQTTVSVELTVAEPR
jgi:hypothetical protein